VKIGIYDATLTEGAREAGTELSVRDKLRVALRLAEMGVAYVEGGWPQGRGPGAEIFREARRLEMGGACLCACARLSGHGRADLDAELTAALRSGAPGVTLSVPVLGGRGAGARAASHLAAGVHAIRRADRRAIVELQGFFDALRHGSGPALAMVEDAASAGAEAVLLGDTSGGALPREVEAGVAAARRAARRTTTIGVWARDDGGLAVANCLAAVGKGATLLAVTVNGYGERCGAADLIPVAAALELKMGHQALAPGQLKRLTSLAHFVAELAERETPRDQPYVGRDAFATTDGAGPLHVDPEAVGNRAEQAMADERGHPDALRAVRALGLPARGEAEAKRVLERLAEWEKRGFRYEGAEGSFELILRALAGRRRRYFEVLGYRVLDVNRERKGFTEATVEIAVGRERLHAAAIGVGPVNALDRALRRALEAYYPELSGMQLVQWRSRNLTSGEGSAGAVRVLVESADTRDRWATAGVSEDLFDACCQALVDAIAYKLAKDDVPPRAAAGRRSRAGARTRAT
jgi:2-isopropylmalate synthase